LNKNPVTIAIILILLPLANAYDLLNNNGLNYYISYLYDGDNLKMVQQPKNRILLHRSSNELCQVDAVPGGRSQKDDSRQCCTITSNSQLNHL